MNPAIAAVLIGLVTTTIFGMIGYLFKRDQKNQDDMLKDLDVENKLLNNKIIAIESDVRLLNNKLWSDEKLGKVITDAVNLAFSEWQLRMIQEGWFHLGKSENRKAG